MTTPRIAVAHPLPDAFIQALEQLGEVFVMGPDMQDMDNVSVIVASAMHPIDADFVSRCPDSVGLVANIGVGTDNIDFDAVKSRNIAVSNTPVVTEDTADLTMALLLATCRRLSTAERLLRAGDFESGSFQLGLRVHGKTLGIVGFGAIGQAVAKRAHGFDMDIIYHGPNRKQAAEKALDAKFCDELDSLLQQADIISLNCALTTETRHILNRERLAKVKAGAVIINTGRGALIDEAALIEALESGHLGGAGLDVYEFEPAVSTGLLKFDNVTLLPHIGSSTGVCRQEMAMRVINNIRAFFETGSPVDACP